MQRLVLVVALLCALAVPARAGFDEGLAAYERGDYAAALREFLPLAEQGDATAQFALGLMYDNGEGVPQDDAEAAKWYRRAAEQGDASAQYNLGVMYDNGYGVPQDHAEAVKWYRLAAQQGVAKAQYNLGLMYGNGQGVPQDYAEAAKWYRRAAEQGFADAQNNLGFMYGNGQGVPQDYVEAHQWYNLAASRLPPGEDRDRAVRNRDIVEGRMTPAQIGEAQRRAREWRPKTSEATVAPPAASRAASMERVDRETVAAIQHNLAELGYDPGPADGRPGPKTRAAIRAFEAENRLPVTGEVSRELRQALLLAKLREMARQQTLALESTGTGFVVSAEGHVLTNHHVVEGCAEVRTPASGAGPEPFAVVALDAYNDLAVVRLSPITDMLVVTVVASFREGRGVRPGDGVVAVGFPLHGLLASGVNVTTGTVSALAGIRDDIRYLQITAPVQPGNSGGPLLDMSGNVVGVVVGKLDALAVAEVTGDIPQNVNFAIKDSVARAFLDAQGIDYETAPAERALDAADVGELARRFTVLLECWK